MEHEITEQPMTKEAENISRKTNKTNIIDKKDKKDEDVYLQAINMIEPDMGWTEICSESGARADLSANQIELAWLDIQRLTKLLYIEAKIY